MFSRTTTNSRPDVGSQLLSDEPLQSVPAFRMKLSPQQYADHVNAYVSRSSTQSLYPGTNFESLASFLSRAYRRLTSNPQIPKTFTTHRDEHSFVIHYDMKNNTSARGREFISPNELLEYKDHNIREEDSANLLFLRGYPSAQWLNNLGSQFTIDPEYFRRHLDFQKSATSLPDFSLPPLPSATPTMTRLRINTVAKRMDNRPVRSRDLQEDLDMLRKEVKLSFSTYLETLQHGSNIDERTGDSIVRDVCVLNREYSIIEQDMSIYVEQLRGGIFAVVWTDASRDLYDTVPGPWNSGSLDSSRWSVEYLPTIQSTPFAALRHEHLLPCANLPNEGHLPRNSARIPQSAAFLPLDYMRYLDPETARTSHSFALGSIFYFAASSELLALNVIETSLNNELEPDSILAQESPTISNLLHLKSILSRHINRLKDNISFTKQLQEMSPIHAQVPGRGDKFETGPIDLSVALQSLLDRATLLSVKCDRGMDVISTQASIREAGKGIAQAKATAKLTRLALPFIPLSLTTSFFGMNFVELDRNSLSIWVWFVTSVVVLMGTFAFLLWGQMEVKQRSVGLKERYRQRTDRTSMADSDPGKKGGLNAEP